MKLSKSATKKRLNEADKKLMLVFTDGHHNLSITDQAKVLDYAMKIRKIVEKMK